MPPDKQDSDEHLDAAPVDEPEEPEGARGRGRRSKKGRQRSRGKRRGDAKGVGARGVGARAEEARVSFRKASAPTDPPPEVENVDLDAVAPAVDTPETRERIVAGAVALVATDEGGQDPSPAGGGDGEETEESQKRRARVAAYSDPGDAHHSASELEGVAELARELALLSTPETRSRLLAEAVAHSEAKEARYRVPMAEPGAALRWKAPLALAIFLAAALVAVAPPAWVVPPPPAQLDVADRLYGIRLSLLFQAQQVEAFRAREQRLPDSLDEVAVRLAGIRFVRSSSRVYQLVGYTPGGEAVVYDATNPGPAFERLAAAWRLSPDAQ